MEGQADVAGSMKLPTMPVYSSETIFGEKSIGYTVPVLVRYILKVAYIGTDTCDSLLTESTTRQR
eukprot:scaffold57770_cov63-Attheya_sp.AAC.9